MAKTYSDTDDMIDPLIQGITTDEDHEEAGRVIERELRKRGIDPALVISTDGLALLKELSVIYASLYRCRLAMSESGDAYHVRVEDLKDRWKEELDDLSYEKIMGAIYTEAGKTLLGSVAVRRG